MRRVRTFLIGKKLLMSRSTSSESTSIFALLAASSRDSKTLICMMKIACLEKTQAFFNAKTNYQNGKPQITSVHEARNPVLVTDPSVWNLTFMVLPMLVKGPGFSYPQYFCLKNKLDTSTKSHEHFAWYSTSKLSNFSSILRPLLASSVHSF